ncbi:hypothetical protein BWD08_10570 [Neisseria animaloris]|nr:hypothetical protein BWD08_10570 [Neisseria animaloris]
MDFLIYQFFFALKLRTAPLRGSNALGNRLPLFLAGLITQIFQYSMVKWLLKHNFLHKHRRFEYIYKIYLFLVYSITAKPTTT